MSAKESSFHGIELLGKKSDGKSSSVKFLAHEDWRGYKKLLICEGKTVGVNKVPTQSMYEMAQL